MSDLPFHSDFTCQYYSRNDFLRTILSRVRKDIKLQGGLAMETIYLVSATGLLTQEVLVKLLEEIFSGRLRIVRSASADATVLGTSCLEEYLDQRLDIFFSGKDISGLQRTIIHPLRTVSKEELLQLAQIFAVTGTAPTVHNEFIERLQASYKQTKPSLLKSFLSIEHRFENLSEKQ